MSPVRSVTYVSSWTQLTSPPIRVWLHLVALSTHSLHHHRFFYGLPYKRRQLPNRFALRLRNHLLRYILSRARPAMPHQPLRIFHIYLRLIHPGGTGASQDLPIHPTDANFRAAGLMCRDSTMLSRIGAPVLTD